MLCDHIDHIDHSLAGSPTFHVDGKTSSSFLRHSGLTRNLGSFIPVILYLQREDINDSSFANAKHHLRRVFDPTKSLSRGEGVRKGVT